MKVYCLTIRDLWKLYFGKFDYGVGDILPKGLKFSDLDTEEVKKAKIMIRILSRFKAR